MQHCDDETLSLLALGEPVPATIAHHLATCPECTDELSTLRLVVNAARDVGPESSRVAPPARVWEQIAAATGVTTTPRQSELNRYTSEQATVPAGVPREASPLRRPRRSRRPEPSLRRRPDRFGLMLAAACLLIGLLGGGVGTWLLTDRGTPRAPVLAATTLAGLPLAPGAVGRADVVSTTNGRELDLDVQRLGIPAGFYEVWLIDPTVTKMVPIGVLSGSTGRFTLPNGVKLSSYPVLDISIQPLNGDPKHSGRSVLRGTFKT